MGCRLVNILNVLKNNFNALVFLTFDQSLKANYINMKSNSCLFFLLSFFCGIFIIQAQKEVLNLPTAYKSVFYDDKESLAISNPNTKELVIFVEDVDNSKAVLLDEGFSVIDQLTLKSLERSFKTFIGYQINDDKTYSLFFTNKAKKKFGVLVLDFQTGEIIQKKLDFELSGESYVEGISHETNFYLMSVTKSGSNVHFYKFKDLGVVAEKKSVDFSFLNKIGYNDNHITASSYLNSSLIKVDVKSPNAIETTSSSNKLYVVDENFVFTFDKEKDKTQVAIVSPNENFKVSLKAFEKPILKAGLKNHNSYLYNGKIYQVTSTPKALVFTIKDFNSNVLIKELNIKREQKITFKNSPIIQEGTSFGNNTRHLETTSQFLRKASRGDIGISTYLDKGKYKITIGSKIEKPQGGGFGPMGGFPMASFGAISATFNPTFFAYGNYSSSKSTYIDCVFDENFNHINGEVPTNSFDKINVFEDKFVSETSVEVIEEESNSDMEDYGVTTETNVKEDKNQPKLKNVFYHNNKLYFGFIGAQDKNYHLVEIYS